MSKFQKTPVSVQKGGLLELHFEIIETSLSVENSDIGVSISDIKVLNSDIVVKNSDIGGEHIACHAHTSEHD